MKTAVAISAPAKNGEHHYPPVIWADKMFRRGWNYSRSVIRIEAGERAEECRSNGCNGILTKAEEFRMSTTHRCSDCGQPHLHVDTLGPLFVARNQAQHAL